MFFICLCELVLPLPVLYGGVVRTPIFLEPIRYDKLVLISALTILGRTLVAWGDCFYER